MKKTLLSLATIVASVSAMYAQPVLSGTDLNPVPVETFYGHQTDTTGIVITAPGASLTWNYATLTETGLDTTTYLACTATPYCDSFAGSNIVSFDNTNYVYGIANSSRFSFIGAYTSGTYGHITHGMNDIMMYPLHYNDTHKDTFDFNLTFMGFAISHHEIDSMVYDAYGTLTLPSGTYPNAVRVHRFKLSKDSSLFTGASLALVETYEWFTSGFHNPLFTYTLDTSGGTMAEYYVQNRALATSVVNEANSLSVYPNPASDIVNLNFALPANQPATITLSDMTGRTVSSISVNATTGNNNNISIPVANIPAGMYLVQLQSASGNITRKVSIAH